MVLLLFRVGIALILGVFGYAIDVRVLAKYGFDLPSLFGSSTSPREVVTKTTQLGSFLLVFWLIVAIVNEGLNKIFGMSSDLLLWPGFAVLLAAIFREKHFRSTFLRIARGGLNADHRLGDILVADALISYAPVLVDLVLASVIAFNKGDPYSIDRASINPFILLAGSVPTGIRIKQCFLDWRRSGKKQHLANLLKYIVGNIPNSLRIQMLEKPQLAKWLPLALAVSSIYGLFWDIIYDWQLYPGSRNRKKPLPAGSYQAAIIFDSLTRFAWVFAVPTEVRIFSLELVELVRRIAWAILRVESDPVRPVSLDIPLAEIS